MGKDFRGARFWSNFQFIQTKAEEGFNLANYVGLDEAASYGLATLGQSDPFALTLSVDNVTMNSPTRKSVKIQSTTKFGDGIYILDINHFPSACGVWPSFYTFTGNESDKQEIDIIQNVNNLKDGPLTTLYTNNQCQMNSYSSSMTGSLGNQVNCMDTNQNSSGCTGYFAALGESLGNDHQSTSNLNLRKRENNRPSSLGQIGETLIVMQRDFEVSQAVSIWAFNSSTVPMNLNDTLSFVGQSNGMANSSIILSTSTWPMPNILFSLSTSGCEEEWQEHYLVVDIALCGDWGDQTYDQGNCVEKYKSCEVQVANDPSSFDNAFWSINSITVFAGDDYTAPPIIPANSGNSVRKGSLLLTILICLSLSFVLLAEY